MAATALTNKPVHLVIGGLHLLPARDEEIQRIASALRVTWMAPGHCTGEPAFALLKAAFGDRYLYAGLGTVITLGPTVKAMGEAGQATDEEDLRTYRTLLAQSDDGPESTLASGYGPPRTQP